MAWDRWNEAKGLSCALCPTLVTMKHIHSALGGEVSIKVLFICCGQSQRDRYIRSQRNGWRDGGKESSRTSTATLTRWRSCCSNEMCLSAQCRTSVWPRYMQICLSAVTVRASAGLSWFHAVIGHYLHLWSWILVCGLLGVFTQQDERVLIYEMGCFTGTSQIIRPHQGSSCSFSFSFF